jgi:hypothetical protein
MAYNGSYNNGDDLKKFGKALGFNTPIDPPQKIEKKPRTTQDPRSGAPTKKPKPKT